jgi:molybdate transport system ATP-binding protein
MKNILISAEKITVDYEGKDILQNISFQLCAGESMAITGSSGSGKTILGKIISGQLSFTSGTLDFNFSGSAKRLLISQQHDFRNLFSSRSYYQQRYDNNYEDNSPLVEDLLQKTFRKEYPNTAYNFLEETKDILMLLRVEHLLKRKLIQLSNGEGKRVQLAQALLLKPKVIVLDNPFTGLDKESRASLHAILRQLYENGIVLFIITDATEIPEFISTVMELEGGKVKNLFTQEEYRAYRLKVPKEIFSFVHREILPAFINKGEDDFLVAVEMKAITIQYGDKVILNNINWTVKKGERWAVTGPNGSGKSTLLSLINADNPKAYGKEIYLFDKKRGSGESIWEIKNKIGYSSPELHIFFLRNGTHTESIELSSGVQSLNNFSQPSISCFEVVSSGLNDQVGSSQQITERQKQQVEYWMELLTILHLREQSFYKTALGEQRLILLARALVKNSPVLILDEPCQGLDKTQTARFLEVVDAVCLHFQKTLIYVSHYQEEIPSCVTKILLLDDGHVKEIQTVG